MNVVQFTCTSTREGRFNMLSDRLKSSRKRLNLTQQQLADKLNTTKGTISNYENEHSTPSNEMLKQLADALDVSVDYLLGRTNNPDKDGKQPNRAFHKFENLTEEEKEYLEVQLKFFRETLKKNK